VARVLADLHNHSCLSPCASLEMSPKELARRAREAGIGLLALTDHNSALNCPAFAQACAAEGIVPVFGIEATTREEVHVLCLFQTAEQALSLGEALYALLPPLPNVPEKMGDQVWVDAEDYVLGEVEVYLGNACDADIEEVAGLCLERGGIVVPAHIDRAAFSMTSQLGFLPPGPYAAVEVQHYPPRVETGGYTVITGSDAHFPGDIGKKAFYIDSGCDIMDFAALRDALMLGRAYPKGST
jgi:3',5'-nucleoside bisphosphate phosphatase